MATKKEKGIDYKKITEWSFLVLKFGFGIAALWFIQLAPELKLMVRVFSVTGGIFAVIGVFKLCSIGKLRSPGWHWFFFLSGLVLFAIGRASTRWFDANPPEQVFVATLYDYLLIFLFTASLVSILASITAQFYQVVFKSK